MTTGSYQKRRFEQAYERARSARDLPWHREEPPEMLRRVVDERGGRRGRALDLGCGAGPNSIYLAQHGYEVTGIDFTPGAIAMAEAAAQAAAVAPRFLTADVLEWESDGVFDLVLDSGCLHSLPEKDRPAYRSKLLPWLGRAADYVLVHFGKRHPLDWRPIGPRRRRRGMVVKEFEPELFLRSYADEIQRTPFPIGPKVMIVSYWFKRV